MTLISKRHKVKDEPFFLKLKASSHTPLTSTSSLKICVKEQFLQDDSRIWLNKEPFARRNSLTVYISGGMKYLYNNISNLSIICAKLPNTIEEYFYPRYIYRVLQNHSIVRCPVIHTPSRYCDTCNDELQRTDCTGC